MDTQENVWGALTWLEAKQDCEERGAHLVYIETEEERKNIAGMKQIHKISKILVSHSIVTASKESEYT